MTLLRTLTILVCFGAIASPGWAQESAEPAPETPPPAPPAPRVAPPSPRVVPPPPPPPPPAPVVAEETPVVADEAPVSEGHGWTARSGANVARAIVFGDSHHALTLMRVIRDRGRVHLVNEEGHSVATTYVSHDRESGLVLLHSDANLGPPAAGAGDLVRAGDTLRFHERARRHRRPAGEVRTVVLAQRTSRLTLGSECTPGEGVFKSEDGSLAGICIGGTRAATLNAAQELFDSRDTPFERSAWRVRLSFDLRYRFQRGFDSVVGGELGIGVLGFDRLGFAVRGGISADADQDDGGALTLDSPIEVTGEVQLHQAFRFGGPSRIFLALGATFRYQRTVTTQTLADFEDGCNLSAGACPVVFTRTQTTDKQYRVFPMARLELDLGVMALSYVALFDVESFRDTTHSIGIGLAY